MTSRRIRRTEPADILHVVLDDDTVERFRKAADRRGVEVEQLIAHVIHRASWRLADLFHPVEQAPGDDLS